MSTVARDAQPAPLAALPSVDRLLRLDGVQPLLAEFGRDATLAAARALLARLRERLLARDGEVVLSEAVLAGTLRADLERAHAARLRRVINLTGTVLHTNLGRAPMPEEA